MQNGSPQSNSNTIHVKIQTPDSVVWEGEADVVSSRNSAGPFDILPDHGNMITIIESSPIEIMSSQGTRNFTFEKAVLSLRSNRIDIFANIQTPSKTPEKQKS